MLKRWLEEYHKAFAVLLLVLAALNGWIAHAIFSKHPMMALTNGAMAVLIVLGVILFWRAGRRG
jgi:hypothetical protein